MVDMTFIPLFLRVCLEKDRKSSLLLLLVFASHPKPDQEGNARVVGMEEDSKPRGDVPLSEIDENDRIMSGCFPHLFMYGRAYDRNG